MCRFRWMLGRSRFAWWLVGGSLAMAAASACGGSDDFAVSLSDSSSFQSVGVEGGVLEARADGVDYRLIFPQGAVREAVEVSVTPIGSLTGLPFDGGLLAGVEVEPSGLELSQPVVLEMRLSSDQRSLVAEAVSDGLAVLAFGYDTPEEGVYVQLAEVSDDFAVIHMTLFGFSGHGAGLGTPQNLGNLPRPSDPFRAAEFDINRILHPPGGPADPADPAVRDAIKDVFQDLFRNHVLPLADAAQSDPSLFEDAVATGNRWSRAALIHLLLSGGFGEWGGELAAEAIALESSLLVAYENAFKAADQKCKASGDISDLERLIELDRIGTINFLDSRLDYILSAEGFCLRLKIATIEAPENLEQGESADVGFWIEPANLANIQTSDLAFLGIEAVFTPDDPALVSTAPPRIGTPTLATFYETTVTGLQAIESSDSEGALTLSIEVLHGSFTLATERVTIDVVPPTITCTGAPGTTNDAIAIVSDGQTCAVATSWSDNEPAIAIELDADDGETNWDDDGHGSNWSRDSSFGQNAAPGDYTITATHLPSGQTVEISFTVTVQIQGSEAILTVSDITLTPTP